MNEQWKIVNERAWTIRLALALSLSPVVVSAAVGVAFRQEARADAATEARQSRDQAARSVALHREIQRVLAQREALRITQSLANGESVSIWPFDGDLLFGTDEAPVGFPIFLGAPTGGDPAYIGKQVMGEDGRVSVIAVAYNPKDGMHFASDTFTTQQAWLQPPPELHRFAVATFADGRMILPGVPNELDLQ